LIKGCRIFNAQRSVKFTGTRWVILITLLITMVHSSFRNRETASFMVIQFKVLINGVPLQLNQNYRNPFDETFQISRFRFYAGKIRPIYTERTFKKNIPSSYHLVDFSDSNSTRFEMAVPSGNFNGIEFTLGIDSADQNSGAQTGELDPVRGMFWTWNSGYQSFKIEGYSPASGQPAHVFAYHIGGYRDPYNTVWNLKLGTTNDELFHFSNDRPVTIEIPIELDYFFEGKTPLQIKEIPVCTTPGELARKISENFIGSFTGLNVILNP
jgi:hypothetical protein